MLHPTNNVQAFGRFLEAAALMNGQVTNLSNLARDSGILGRLFNELYIDQNWQNTLLFTLWTIFNKININLLRHKRRRFHCF